MSQLFLRTLRDAPADADVDSLRLLSRAGYVRKVASGFYSWLPLGARVLRNVERIVREEMDASGAQEVLLPIAQPLELWQQSGREQLYGPLMFRLLDRKGSGFCLAPTAEEVITAMVRAEYSSYRDLPVNLYQIQWKYRDELRPRFGLLRSREFLMKDAYSFDTDAEKLRNSYQLMYDAYYRVFTRCGLNFRPVRAQSGDIGGDVNHEFMAVADIGEDDFVWCQSCDYAANVEAATRRAPHPVEVSAEQMVKIETLGKSSIDAVAQYLKYDAAALLKCLAFETASGAIGLALVPGDREVNEYLLKVALGGEAYEFLDDAAFEKHPLLPKGYIGAHNRYAPIIIADPSVLATPSWVTGANEVDHHVTNAVVGRDFSPTVVAPIVVVATGDTCTDCGGELAVDRGIEVGHVFQIGTKYSEALGATYTDESGEAHPMVMGCYGIGISRVVAAIVEEHHDEAGICWPVEISPYAVHLLAIAGKGAASEEVRLAAADLYNQLNDAGVSVLYDDRDLSPGVKFADADLIGIPVQLVVGSKGLSRGVVERKVRSTGDRDELEIGAVVGEIAGREALQRGLPR